MKGILFILFIFTSCLVANAQQLPQFSQYMINPYMVNPAVGGSEDFAEFMAGFRKAYTGIPDGPVNMYFTAQTPIEKHHGRGVTNKNMSKAHHGAGIIVARDVNKPINMSSATLSYAYNMELTDVLRLAVGASFGFKHLSVNTDGLTTKAFDPLSNVFNITSGPEVGLGAWLHNDRFFLGLSGQQLQPTNIKLGTAQVNPTASKVVNHYYAMAGYRWEVHNDLTIIPTTLLKYVGTKPVSIDIGTKFRYKDIFLVGASYRSRAAIVAMGGFAIAHHLELIYSLDIPLANAFPRTNHEIVLGYRIDFSKNIRSPQHYW